MNAKELNTEITKLIRRAIETGIAIEKPKMTIDEAVGCLARHQHTLLNIDANIRQHQVSSIQQALARQQAEVIIKTPSSLDKPGKN